MHACIFKDCQVKYASRSFRLSVVLMKKQIKYPYKYDPKRRKLAKIYTRGRMWAYLINGIIIPIAFLYIFLSTGSAAVMRDALFGYDWAQVPAYAFMLLWFLTIVTFPLRFYFSYVREHTYKLSNYTLGGWFRDFLKVLILTFIVSLTLITGLYYLLQFGFWWVYASMAFIVLSVVFTYIVPVIILPFFYKLKPYNDVAHKKRLLEIVRKAGVENVKHVLVADESSKSKKANAMFSGFGRTKRIVLFDTLINNFTKDEVETVIGHEAGHYVNKDEMRGLILKSVLIFPVLFIIDIILQSNIGSFGIASIADIAGLPLIMLSFSIIELILMPLENAYSRKMEAEADLFALNACRKPDAQISTEKRLTDMALHNDKDHALIEFLLHSHPSTVERIKMCEEWKRRNIPSRNQW